MSRLRWISIIVFAVRLACGQGIPDRDEPGDGQRPKSPPVLRNSDLADTRTITLPGPAAVRVKPADARTDVTNSPKPAAPKPALSPKVVNAPLANSLPPSPMPAPAKIAPGSRPNPAALANAAGSADRRVSAPAGFPTEFERESAVFLHKRIGHWKAADARPLLGEPLRQRAAVDDNQQENGRILAFPDPTGRYQELELDFDKSKGLLRTVFIYPHDLTWQQCRRLWGGKVSATETNKGRIFYSYQNRRLDVLVAPGGKVISLGLY